MADLGRVTNLDISVVIPALNAENYLPVLIRSIEAQTLLPKEIVIVDSSSSDKTTDIVSEWKGPISIVHKKVDLAYPGKARNIGVELAKSDWVAFIDCRTIPDRNWLEICASSVEQSGAEFVDALFVCDADTHFKRILRAATYGCGNTRTQAGSIVSKKIFQQSGGFQDVRAGEDMEWMHRMKTLGFKTYSATSSFIRYSGLAESLSETIRKWYVYAMASARIEVKNHQKYLYLVIFLGLVFAVVFRWNAVFAQWDEDSIYFMPNITKIFVAFVFSTYMIFRGIIRPLGVEVKLSFLLPWRWLEVGFVGLCIDIAKAPGLIWGAILIVSRRVSNARKVEYKKNH